MAACVALAGATLALMASCAMRWWETSNNRVDPPEESVGRLGQPLVTLTIVAVALTALLRLGVVLRKVPWGAATAQTLTWILFLLGVFVANPQIGGTDMRGQLRAGYFVGLAAAGLVSLAGVIDWPWPARPRPVDGNAVPGPAIDRVADGDFGR